jgi:hypothetical protein
MKIHNDKHFYNIINSKMDIISLIELYNGLERNFVDRPHNKKYLDIVMSLLQMSGLNILDDKNFFNNTELEIPGKANGIIIQKVQDLNYTQIIIKENPYILHEDIKNSYSMKIKIQIQKNYDVNLYRALCRNVWSKKGIKCHYSDFMAAGMVAKFKNDKSDYLDYFCFSGEGYVDDQIETDLNKLGWYLNNE